MSYLSLGVIGSSNKENEQRAPIHPDHIHTIAQELRAKMYFEHGYGERFGVSDEQLKTMVGGLRTRTELFEQCDVILLPKPTDDDFASFREGQVIWGWPHCVQGPKITQVGIDKKLTYIAWEEMHIWGEQNQWLVHVFHINNELAGYCSVKHALQLRGMTGHYGPSLKALVVGFGSVGRGAIHALKGLGYSDITLLTMRPCDAVSAPIPGVKHWQYQQEGLDTKVLLTDSKMPMAEAMGHFDIIVNATLQNTDSPQMFVSDDQKKDLRSGALIVDVSCDEGMGFEFAKPTSFEDPTFWVDQSRNILYYAVDHSPTFLWNSATFSISKALLPHLETVMRGSDGWDNSETIRRSIEIRKGVIQNPKILRFQNRSDQYPHSFNG
ncbi:MAG: alanine dehydrogenase [Proteobacteria bacterium]|nr:alanine dehydrogenase [Pseudomonadota bacterium]